MRTKPGDIFYCGVSKEKILNAKPILDDKVLLNLYKFIRRRYNIHLNKDVWRTKPPWTSDAILSTYRFTNVRREHDRETKWLIKHITSNSDLCYTDKLLNVILFRLFNKHETAELLSMPIKFSEQPDWNPEWYRAVFEAAEAEDPGIKFFTSAFNTGGLKTACKNYLPKKDPKNSMPMRILYFVRTLFVSDIAGELMECTQQNEICSVLSAYKGIGDFLAYQMFVDMTYIEEFPFSENEFTVAGPGCRLGLDYLFIDKDGMTYEECLFWLRDNIDDLFTDSLGKNWDPNRVFWDLPRQDRYLNLMSLENCFCELSKYIKLKKGAGKTRKRYSPRKE